MGKDTGKTLITMNRSVRLVMLLLVLSIPMTFFASLEIGEPFIRNFEPKEYGGHLQVWSITQDPRGVMYFGTNSNIVEFDGKNWRQLSLPNESAVRSLTVDQDGTIYIGAQGEFGYLASDQHGQLIYRSFLDKVPPKDRDFKDVWETHATTHGIYFCAINKIFRWYQNKLSILSISLGMMSFNVFDEVFFYNNESILRLKQGMLQPLPHTDFLQGVRNIVILPFKQNKQMLIITDNKGSCLYDLDEKEKSVETIVKKFSTEIAGYLLHNRLYRAIKLRNNHYALSTRKGGMVIINSAGQLVRIIDENRGLLNNTVLRLFQDQDNNLWADMQGGIAYIEISSPVSRFGNLSGIRSTVLSVTRHQGRIYAGTYAQGPLVLPNYQLKNTDDFHHFSNVDNFHGQYNWDFLTVGKKLLVAADTVNVITNNFATIIAGTPTAYSLHVSKRFPQTIFLGIAEPSNGGLGRLEILPDGNFAYKGKLAGISDVIREIESDNLGNLWLATQTNGLIYIKFTGNNVTDFEASRYTTDHGLPADAQLKIIWNNDHLWVGTNNHGIYQAIPVKNPPSQKISFRFRAQFSPGQYFAGTPKNVSNIIKYNRDKYLILDSALGFITRQKNGIWQVDYNPFRGIEQIQPERIYIEEDGVAWIPTGNGLYRYDPGIEKNFAISHAALIRKVTIKSGQDIFMGIYYDPKSKKDVYYSSFTTTQPTVLQAMLPFKENSLIIEYSCPFFEQMIQNRFQYQLVGFDKQWSGWTDLARKEYTNIPEGDYCFQVRGKNVFEKESGIAEYRFVISPPWYRTYWSYTIYIFVFIFFVYSLISLNSRRLVSAKRKLEIIVAERTAEVVKQKNEIESYASDLSSSNHQLTEAKNALWGEMKLAKKIQTVLLPKKPHIPGYEIAAYMKPADEVGGDYYDVINIAGMNWLAIGDVSGHGVPAGLLMMMVQTSLRSVLKESQGNKSPEKILATVNNIIYENIKKMGEDKYMTITLMSVQENGTIHFSGLHQDIMIYRKKSENIELVETKGMWIGVTDDIEGMVGLDELKLQTGDVLLLYTDGIPESIDTHKTMYSNERLMQLLKNQGIQPIDQIKRDILASLAGFDCHDDITFILLKKL